MKRAAQILAAIVVAIALIVVALVVSFVHDPSYPTLVTVGPRQTLVIRNARIFSATSTLASEGLQVVVADGLIARIEANGIEAPAGATVIDGKGQTLLPGLIDFHTHIVNAPSPPWHLSVPNPRHNLEAYLYAGVTSVASMGDEVDGIRKIHARLESHEWAGPRLWYAGLPITVSGGHPQATVDAVVPAPLRALAPAFAWPIASAAEADAAVAHMADGGASYVKMVVDDLPPGVPKLADDQIKAIVAAAHSRKLKVAAHIGTAEDALRAATQGADVLNHGIHRGPLSREQAIALAATGVSVSPTLIVFERCAQLAAAEVTFDPLEREIEDEALLAQFSSEIIHAHQNDSAFIRPWFEQVLASREQQLKNALTLYQAGVPILVGTDSSILGNMAGASIHNEMALLVKAGIPPAQVLLGATTRPAAFLSPDPKVGRIEPGKIADLLLVEGNPLEDISATRRIATIIQDGRLVQRHTR